MCRLRGLEHLKQSLNKTLQKAYCCVVKLTLMLVRKYLSLKLAVSWKWLKAYQIVELHHYMSQ